MGPAETVELAHVNKLARGSVGLAGVEKNFTFEANRLHHELAEFADGEFLAGAHVDVAVADFAEAGDCAATARAVVAVHRTVGTGAVMHAGVLLDANDVAEVHVQQHVHRGVGHVLAPQELAERLARTPEGHLVILDAVLGKHLQNLFLGCIAVDAFDRALVHVDLDAGPVAVVDELGEVDLAHHGRHHVAVFQVDVVVGPVEVGGHHGDVVGAVLQVVALAHLEARDLRDGVLLIGVLQFAGEQGILFHGLRGVLGVNAGGTQEQKLLHVVRVGLAEHVALDLHVHHHEVGTVERVGHDAAHEGCGKHHRVGAFLVKELLNGILVREVKFLMGAANQVVIAARHEIIPNGRAHQAMVARNVDLSAFVEHFCSFQYLFTGFSKYAFCNNLEIYRVRTREASRDSQTNEGKNREIFWGMEGCFCGLGESFFEEWGCPAHFSPFLSE